MMYASSSTLYENSTGFPHRMSRSQNNIFRKFGIAIFILVFINIIYFSANNNNRGIRKAVKTPDSRRVVTTAKLSKNGTKGIKRVLFWTDFFIHHKDLNALELGDAGIEIQRKYCAYGCEFTVDKELLSSSDAVLFHGRNMETDSFVEKDEVVVKPKNVPAERGAKQHWIFYLFESPVHTFVPLEAFNSFFNMTMTYRLDSDIYVPYQRLVKISDTEKQHGVNNQELLQKKSKKIAWIVSNCETPGKRELLVKELKKYIQVDIYGSCGENSCSTDGTDDNRSCYEEIGKSYKFYLSFENTLCADYVTEKFFNALATGMVPVVYGGADYSKHAPEGSYIDARAFKSVKDLARFLLKLDTYDNLYLKYFEWRKRFRVENITVLQRAWCSLCTKLSRDTTPSLRTTDNLKSWWLRYGNSTVCTRPDFPDSIEIY